VQSEDQKPQSSLPLASFNYINSIIGSGVIGKFSKLYIYVRFKVLTVVSMKMRAFWVIAPYSLVGVDQRFRGMYCLHHQDDETP
jgi:hypothetical protein